MTLSLRVMIPHNERLLLAGKQPNRVIRGCIEDSRIAQDPLEKLALSTPFDGE